MKLLRYGAPGREKPGLLDANGTIRDLSGVIPDLSGDALLAESLAKLGQLDPKTLPAVDGNPRIGPCVGGVGKFICVGLNYSDHAAESGMKVPSEPIIFMKATSSIVGPNDDLEIPRGSEKTDWEVELGVVIGRTAKYVDESSSMDYVAGFCVVHDVSERAFQTERGGQWSKGKSAETFNPAGPWLVTPDEIDDVGALDMWLDVNGVRRQTGNTRTMVFDPYFVVHYLSQFLVLEPGDLIDTGTPPGVGMGFTPPIWLQPGDVMELGIEGLGVQRQKVLAPR